MTLNLPLPPRVRRESRSALAQELMDLRQAQASASGTALPDVQALSAAEAAAGLWSRALSSGASDTLDAAALAIIGRGLVSRGESVWYVSDGLEIIPCADWDVRSPGARFESWTYRVSMATPSGQTTRVAGPGRVLHFRINVSDRAPWRGRSPWAVASATALLARRLEQSLDNEERSPIGHVLPVPDVEQSAGLPDQIAALRGDVVLGQTTQSGWDEGRQRAPAGDWRPVRIGPAPPDAQQTLRQDVRDDLLTAAGVPVELAYPRSAGEAREGWRRFLHSTIAPVGQLVGAEARRVLGGSGVIDFRSLFASDLQGRARAYRQLVDAGMAAERARRICGLDD